ncbi:MAG: ABC transporter substrate-binding protein [Chloroflexota bacterium]|nr:ABC transporter substrate-binding protein [Chloroflexota bacterium]
MPSKSAVIFRLLLLATLGFAHLGLRSAAQVTLRIGVIDFADGSMLKGALLAAEHINASDQLSAADGTAINLAVVNTPPDNMEIAIANMRQANAIAVIGPETEDLLSAYMSQLQALNVPIMTPATGDTVLLQDNTQRIFRVRARQSLTASAVADYLVNTLAVDNIRTVQLDASSTGRLIIFANALSTFGVRLSNTLVDESNPDLAALARDIAESDADLVAIYAPPLLAAPLYNQILAAGYKGDFLYDQADDPAFADMAPINTLPGIIGSSTWSPALPDSASETFVLEFARAFGHLPDAVAASSYDATRAVAAALIGAGSISENLASLLPFSGVQGELNSANLLRGEISSNTLVTRLNEYGAENVVAYYRGGEQLALIERPLVQSTPRPAPTARPAPTSTPSGYTLTIQSAVQNVRSGPGLQFEAIGQLQRGTQARVLGATPDYAWLVIDFRGQWGWLASYLVATFGNRNLLPVIQPPATPTPVPTPTPAPPQDPDLVVLHASPPRLILDQPMSVNVTLRNQGLTASGQFAVAASFEPGGVYAGVNAPWLDAGEQTTVQLSSTLTGATGPQSVIIVVDLNQQVAEGPAGEANNKVYAYNYIADRAFLATGASTIGVGYVDLDGFGVPDLEWTGADLVAQGDGGMYLMSYFSSIDGVHYDTIDTSLANLKTLHIDQLTNATIGLRTTDGHHAVLKPTNATRDGAFSFDYRVYR